MQTLHNKFNQILDSLTNGQRKQALEQIKRLSLADRWECVEYARYIESDRIALIVAKMAITKGV